MPSVGSHATLAICVAGQLRTATCTSSEGHSPLGSLLELRSSLNFAHDVFAVLDAPESEAHRRVLDAYTASLRPTKMHLVTRADEERSWASMENVCVRRRAVLQALKLSYCWRQITVHEIDLEQQYTHVMRVRPDTIVPAWPFIASRLSNGPQACVRHLSSSHACWESCDAPRKALEAADVLLPPPFLPMRNLTFVNDVWYLVKRQVARPFFDHLQMVRQLPDARELNATQWAAAVLPERASLGHLAQWVVRMLNATSPAALEAACSVQASGATQAEWVRRRCKLARLVAKSCSTCASPTSQRLHFLESCGAAKDTAVPCLGGHECLLTTAVGLSLQQIGQLQQPVHHQLRVRFLEPNVPSPLHLASCTDCEVPRLIYNCTEKVGRREGHCEEERIAAAIGKRSACHDHAAAMSATAATSTVKESTVGNQQAKDPVSRGTTAPIRSIERVAIATTVAYRPSAGGTGNTAAGAGAYSGSLGQVERYVYAATTLIKSLNAVGSAVDRIALTAYLRPSHLATLARAGYCVIDLSEDAVAGRGIDMRRFYSPLYSERQARADGRPWLGRTQARIDGAATYYKFFAWALTPYERVLHIDADFAFGERPDAFLTTTTAYFQAKRGVAGRSYVGLNSHRLLVTPDANIFALLLAKAASGQYFTYTNTDQDVIETIFPPSVGGDGGPLFVTMPAGNHSFGARMAGRGEGRIEVAPGYSLARPRQCRQVKEAVERVLNRMVASVAGVRAASR